jgi:hypothetical protein
MSSSQTPEMKVSKTVKKIIESLTNSHTISDSGSHTSTSSISPVKVVKVVKGGNIKGVNIKGGNIKGPKINMKTSVAKSTNFIDSIKTNVIKKIMTYVSHPKFKWIVAALLLCTLAFAYFKYQQHIKNKKIKAVKNSSAQANAKAQPPAQAQIQNNHNIAKEPMPQQFQQFSNVGLNEETIRNQLDAQLIQQQLMQQQLMHQQLNKVQMMQEKANSKNHVNVKPGKKQKNVKIVDPEESTTEDESDEIFMEDQNVMTHNLTMDEMNAIDKQLEDVHIDNTVNSD